MGVFIVFSITVAGPRIGIVATTAFLIAAQFGLAAAIDRYGWFGVERVATTWPRIVGIALLARRAPRSRSVGDRRTRSRTLEPRLVWSHFLALTRIPRPPKQEEQVARARARLGRRARIRLRRR